MGGGLDAPPRGGVFTGTRVGGFIDIGGASGGCNYKTRFFKNIIKMIVIVMEYSKNYSVTKFNAKLLILPNLRYHRKINFAR